MLVAVFVLLECNVQLVSADCVSTLKSCFQDMQSKVRSRTYANADQKLRDLCTFGKDLVSCVLNTDCENVLFAKQLVIRTAATWYAVLGLAVENGACVGTDVTVNTVSNQIKNSKYASSIASSGLIDKNVVAHKLSECYAPLVKNALLEFIDHLHQGNDFCSAAGHPAELISGDAAAKCEKTKVDAMIVAAENAMRNRVHEDELLVKIGFCKALRKQQ